MKVADKDMLETLSILEFYSEMCADDPDGDVSAAQAATTFRRLAREADYEIPVDFNWQEHLPE